MIYLKSDYFLDHEHGKKNNGTILKGKLNIMSTLTFGSRIMLCKLKILFFLLSCLSFFLNGATVLFLIFQQQKP